MEWGAGRRMGEQEWWGPGSKRKKAFAESLLSAFPSPPSPAWWLYGDPQEWHSRRPLCHRALLDPSCVPSGCHGAAYLVM